MWSIAPPSPRNALSRSKNAFLSLFIYNIFCAHDTMLFFYYFLYFVHFQLFKYIVILQCFVIQYIVLFYLFLFSFHCSKIPIFAIFLTFCTVIFAYSQKNCIFISLYFNTLQRINIF